MSRSQKLKMPLSLFILTLALGITFTVFSASAEEKKESTQNIAPQSGDEISSMKVGKDQDGALRPTTKEEDKALAAQIRNTLRNYQKQSLKSHANGAKSVVTVPYSLAFSVASVEAGGKVQYHCSTVTSIDKKKTVEQSQETAEE